MTRSHSILQAPAGQPTPTEPSTLIELQQVSKVFSPGKLNEVVALKEVNLSIKQGEFVVVVGSNGSGKTTLLNLVAGAELPSSGQIWIQGEEVSRLPEHRRSRWIARVFQNPLGGTAPDLSILDNFRLAALRTRKRTLRIGINDAFRQKVRDQIAQLDMGLETKLDLPMGALSGGQRQALTLLMSVMDHAEILLLDEPTAALDPRSADLVMRLAEQLIQDYHLTAILVTHNLRDAHRYGNRLLHMRNGTIANDLNAAEKKKLEAGALYQWFLG